MVSPYLHEGAEMQQLAQLTLRDGSEVLTGYKWRFVSQGVVHRLHHAHDGGNRALIIVLFQAANGAHWHIDQMIEMPQHY